MSRETDFYRGRQFLTLQTQKCHLQWWIVCVLARTIISSLVTTPRLCTTVGIRCLCPGGLILTLPLTHSPQILQHEPCQRMSCCFAVPQKDYCTAAEYLSLGAAHFVTKSQLLGHSGAWRASLGKTPQIVTELSLAGLGQWVAAWEMACSC